MAEQSPPALTPLGLQVLKELRAKRKADENLKATLAALRPTKRKSSRSSLLTAKCVIGPVWEGMKQMSCRTHRHDGRGDGMLYVRECAACGKSYHAKYLRSPGYCSQACQRRDHRKRKANERVSD